MTVVSGIQHDDSMFVYISVITITLINICYHTFLYIYLYSNFYVMRTFNIYSLSSF